MPSSSAFLPLAGGEAAAGDPFRPFGLPAPAAVAAPEPAAEGEAVTVEPADEIRRAFQAGYEAARAELEEQSGTIAESFGAALEELGAFRARLRDRYERELLEVALGVARKVVQQELAERPEIWLGMIRAAVRRAVERERIVIRVPATLSAFLRQRLPELHAALEQVRDLQVIEDPTLPPAGCVVESSFSEIDIGVETQIEAARTALLGVEE